MKMCPKHVKICYFYAEIVQLRLILTHLELFWGKTGGGGEKIFLGKCPHAPLWHCHCLSNYTDFIRIV